MIVTCIRLGGAHERNVYPDGCEDRFVKCVIMGAHECHVCAVGLKGRYSHVYYARVAHVLLVCVGWWERHNCYMCYVRECLRTSRVLSEWKRRYCHMCVRAQ